MSTLANKINVFILFMGTCPQFDIKKLITSFCLKDLQKNYHFLFNNKETTNTDNGTTQKTTALCFHEAFIIPLSKLSPSIKIQCKSVIHKAASYTVT